MTFPILPLPHRVLEGYIRETDLARQLNRSVRTLQRFAAFSVGRDRMQRNFEPMRKQVEAWQKYELTDVTAKVVIYEGFVEGKFGAPKHARTVHDLHFEPKCEEFRRRTIWSLSNAFTSAFKRGNVLFEIRVLGLGYLQSENIRVRVFTDSWARLLNFSPRHGG